MWESAGYKMGHIATPGRDKLPTQSPSYQHHHPAPQCLPSFQLLHHPLNSGSTDVCLLTRASMFRLWHSAPGTSATNGTALWDSWTRKLASNCSTHITTLVATSSTPQMDSTYLYFTRRRLRLTLYSQDETSEMFIGEWAEAKGIRDQLFIATKVCLPQA